MRLACAWGHSLAAEMRWHIVLTVPNVVASETGRKMLSTEGPKVWNWVSSCAPAEPETIDLQDIIWFTEGGKYFQWHLVAAFSQWWTLGSGRCFLPAPNCPSLYWSSEHSAEHIYFWSCCAIRPLREVRCRRKGNLMVCGQFNCVQLFKKSIVFLYKYNNNNRK